MAASPPSVSVIIATYNWSNVLPYSIGSVLRQTVADFELLVVGDGCTDDSEAVVQRVGDPRVQWINLPTHMGHQSGPNNEGLRRARGEFIAYLGHDDLWLPHHLFCLTSALKTGADLAYAITEAVGPEGSFVRPDPPTLQYRPGAWIPPTCVVHRRSLTDDLGGWRNYRELRIGPDSELWLRAYSAGYRFAFVPRLTAVKFPAGWRRDVYKIRPHHEQAAWSGRIRNEDDFEMVELARMLLAVQHALLSTGQQIGQAKPYRLLLQDFFRETRRRIRRRLSLIRGRIARLHPHRRRTHVIEAHRRFKGLDRTPENDP